MIGRLLPSLKARVLIATVLVVCATAVCAGGAVAVAARSWIYQDAQDEVFDAFREEVGPILHRDPSTVRADRLPAGAIVTVGSSVTRDPAGTADLLPGDLRSRVDATAGTYQFERLSSDRIALGFQPVTHSDQAPKSIFVVRGLDHVSDRLTRLTWLLVAGVAGSVVVGLLAGLVLVRVVVRPLRRIEATTARVAAGDRSVRMPAMRESELRHLSATFNDMLDRHDEALSVVRQQEQRARRFVADVSHELRSPLAALVPAAEVIDEELSDEHGARAQSARLVATEITALANLVEDLLEMTRVDAGSATVNAEPVNLARTVREAIARRGWHDAAVTGADPAVVVTDARRSTAVVSNLVGNAEQHGTEPVTVEVVQGPDTAVTVTVRDRGTGIDEEHLPYVFGRMYKVSTARTRRGGSGLGLAIARDNARLLGGDVHYAREDGTTVFTAVFPPVDPDR